MLSQIRMVEFLQKLKKAEVRRPGSLKDVQELLEDACKGEGETGNIPEISKVILEIVEPERIGGLQFADGTRVELNKTCCCGKPPHDGYTICCCGGCIM